ncbi:MAG: HAD-IA family hydrolase [bacterium]|nr:HAD-IA family hydrolase [bacterium]MDZ4346216.1 HAD-IA family hydrolase [Candidatus Binatia bacterium]
MKKLLVFDCYQTLIYKPGLGTALQKFLAKELKAQVSLKHINLAFKIMYNRHKFQHAKFSTEKQRRNYYRGYNQYLLNTLGLDISIPVADRLNKVLSRVPYVSYPDVISTLQYLKSRHYQLGLLANWTSQLEQVLSRIKLTKYFDFVFASHNLGVQKPDPRFFTKALRRHRKKYDKVYYVGDDYDLDVIPARRAKLIPVLIDRENNYPTQTDCTKVKTLRSLIHIIN